jgi:leader peptidase (prepilin peptidase)/N-methyltransferase
VLLDGASFDPGGDPVAVSVALLVGSPFGLWFAGLWGALWGSFFNVCIHRVGLYQSVVRPPSRCPRCGRGVRPLENVPIVSWLFLRGRCAGCHLPISVRYPLVEALSMGLAILLWIHLLHRGGDPLHLVSAFFFYFALIGVLIVLTGIDFDHFVIPDVITYPAIPIFFVGALLVREVPLRELVLGPFVGYGLVLVTAEVGILIAGREVMGYGDAKLLAVVGAALGWRAPFVAFFTAPFVGLIVMVPLLLVRRRRVLGGGEVPYGPFLAITSVGYLFFFDYLAGWWPF